MKSCKTNIFFLKQETWLSPKLQQNIWFGTQKKNQKPTTEKHTSTSVNIHRMAISNRRNNTIGHLKIDGVLTSNQEVVEDGILRFYKNLYTEDKTHLPHPDVLNFSMITRDKAGWLEQLFDKGEIFGMLKGF